jgi:hypothetical protein
MDKFVAKANIDSVGVQAAALSVPERLLLFCVASASLARWSPPR